MNQVRFCIMFTAVLPFTYTFFVGTFVLGPRFVPLLRSPTSTGSQCSVDRPLRVFMYDLPKKFNIGMLDSSNSKKSGFVPGSKLPPWPKWGTKEHHSMEYWLMASLLYEGDDGEREAVRVLDPETADVFFVPFFSSLSFYTHRSSDHQLQMELVEILYQSKYWQRSQGRDHVIPMTFPAAFRFLRQQVNASILIIVDFGPYPRNLSSLTKDVVSPYTHVVETFLDDNPPDPYQSRTFLLHFRGNTLRKNEGAIRGKLAKILAGNKDVLFEQSTSLMVENINLSAQEMRSSKFCLHLPGDMPSSCRLFDIIVSHCIPVIVSDHIELPFEDVLDYSEFSVFFSAEEAAQPGYMVDQLRRFSKDRWVEMWRRVKEVSRHFEFQHPPKREDAVNMLWRQVKHKVPAVKLAVHRSRRLRIPDWWD